MHNALGQKPVNLFKAGLSQFRTGSTFKSKNVIVKTCWKSAQNWFQTGFRKWLRLMLLLAKVWLLLYLTFWQYCTGPVLDQILFLKVVCSIEKCTLIFFCQKESRPTKNYFNIFKKMDLIFVLLSSIFSFRVSQRISKEILFVLCVSTKSIAPNSNLTIKLKFLSHKYWPGIVLANAKTTLA